MTKISNNKSGIFDILNYAIMSLLCITVLFPLFDMLWTSVTPVNTIRLSYLLPPSSITFDSYVYIFTENSMFAALGISVFRTVAGTILHLIIVLLAAYPLSKNDLKGRKYIMMFFIIPMYFSGGLIPSYLVNRALGLVDNILVYIVPTMFSAFIMLIVRNYLMTMEKALEEAAFIDGASVMQVLFMIIIPLSKPVLATVALWQMVDQWNAWVDNMIYIRDENKYVLQFILRRLVESSAQTEQAMMYYSSNRGIKLATAQVQAAITFIVLLPIVSVYPFLQKYFVKGIILGAVKG